MSLPPSTGEPESTDDPLRRPELDQAASDDQPAPAAAEPPEPSQTASDPASDMPGAHAPELAEPGASETEPAGAVPVTFKRALLKRTVLKRASDGSILMTPEQASASGPADIAAPPEERAEERAVAVPRPGLLEQLRGASGWLMLGSLLLLVFAQFQLQQRELPPLVVAALVGGLAAWLLTIVLRPPAPDLLPALPEPRRFKRVQWAMLAFALIFMVITYLRTGQNEIKLGWLLPWLGGCALWIAAWWPRQRGAVRIALSDRERLERLVFWLTLGAITLLGAYLRLHRYDITPAEPTSDHAEKLLDMYDLLNGKRPLFLERNTGREPMQFYFTLLLMKYFGMPLRYETLKFGTALADVAVIPCVYLMGAELAGRRAGLLAALLYSISKWTISMALIGLRVAYAPLFSALLLWALLRYMRTGDRRDALLSGLFFGLGFYGYTPFRLFVLVVPLVIVLMLIFDRRWRRSPVLPRLRALVGHGLLIGLTALIVFLPMLHFMQKRPDLFWERANSRLVGSSLTGEQISQNALGALLDQMPTFLENNRNALLAFNWKGDGTSVNQRTDDQIIDPVSGAALLAGLLLALYYLIWRRSLRYAALLLALPLLMMASTLSLAFPLENPSVNRMIAIAPIIMLLAALPLARLADTIAAVPTRYRLTGAWLSIGLLLALATRENYNRFFVEFHQQYLSFVPNTSEAAAAIRGASVVGVTPDHAYHVSYPHWFDTRSIGFMLDDPHWAEKHVVLDPTLPLSPDGAPMLFLMHKDDVTHREMAKQQWPEGVLTLVPSKAEGKQFYTFYVPGNARVEEVTLAPEPATLPDGEQIMVYHSLHDMGSIFDLFDGNNATLMRGADDNPFIIELALSTPRSVAGVDLSVASMDFILKALLLDESGKTLSEVTEQFVGMPADPSVSVSFPNGPHQAARVRLEITQLMPPEQVHIHVREVTLR